MTILPLSEDQAFQLGVEAYIYGYPLVLMDITKALSTAIAAPQGLKAPINQFAHLKALNYPNFCCRFSNYSVGYRYSCSRPSTL